MSIALLAILGAAGCPSKTPGDTPARDAEVVRDAGAIPEAAAPLDAATDAPSACSPSLAPKALANVACVDERVVGHVMGYAQDGKHFGFCITTCDACPDHCEITVPNKPNVSFTFATFQEFARAGVTEEEIEKKLEKANAPHRRFLEEKGFPKVTAQRELHGPWKYPDLVLVTRSSLDEKKGTAILEVGASENGAEPVFPLRLEMGPHPMRNVRLPAPEPRSTWAMRPAVAAVVDVTPDGSELGVVAFSTGAMWFEDARAARIGMDAFAAKVHEATKSK